MAEIFSECPNCGHDEMYASNGMQTAIRECSNCGRLHCQECPETKSLQTYVCPFCKSNKIKPIGCIRNPR